VHDELDGSLPPTPAGTEALAEVRHIMETCVPLAIPLVADQTIAASWGGTK
jgi:DNA polymerase I-like protein with 3'-5' exonuclease and polymerase domains